MRDNVIDYADMKKEFLKRKKYLRCNKVVQEQESAKIIPLTDEQNHLTQRKKEFWKYLMNEFVNNKNTEEVANRLKGFKYEAHI